MNVTILWTGEAAEAQGRESTFSCEWVEEQPDELILHADTEHEPSTTIDREYVVGFLRHE